MSTPQNWGPRPGGPDVKPTSTPKRVLKGCLLIYLGMHVITAILAALASPQTAPFGLLLLAIAVGVFIWWRGGPGRKARAEQEQADKMVRDAEEWRARLPENMIAHSASPLEEVKALSCSSRGTVFLGVTPDRREWRVVEPEQAVLVLGPPRSGKTSALIIPTVLTAPGPVVATSTKGDILDATARSRSVSGRVWLFDPSGEEPLPSGALRLHWTPVTASRTWDGARLMADAMVDASEAGKGVENASYWTETAKTLIAPLLYAASLGGKSVLDVRRWITRMDLLEAGAILEKHDADAAADDLAAIAQTEERERSSVFSTARLVLNAYGSEAVSKTCVRQNFDANKFVRSQDTIYVISPSTYQNLMAPLVVGLLEEIRRATYAKARADAREGTSPWPPVIWALDEIANIAPIKKLPGILSEGGGQGLQVMACFQDLSQARARWKEAADGFLTLFGVKAVFSGVGDSKTLSALSTLVGDWDRPYTVVNRTTGQSAQIGFPSGVTFGHNTSTGVTYQAKKEALLSSGDVANIPPGHLLIVQANKWGLAQALPHHSAPVWSAIIRSAPPQIISQGPPDNMELTIPLGEVPGAQRAPEPGYRAG